MLLLYIFMEVTSCAQLMHATCIWNMPCRTVYATQETLTCIKSTIEALHKGVEYLQMVFSLFTMNIFHTFLVFLSLTQNR